MDSENLARERSCSQPNLSNMELLHNSAPMEGSFNKIMQVSNECFYDDDHHQPQLPMAFNDLIPGSTDPNVQIFNPLLTHFFPASHGYNNVRTINDPEITANSSPIESAAANMNYGGKKRKKNNEGKGAKSREVVHVRARRGQATDSHSLAERSRREKINEKLRSLQDLVPGCYKTMGMAVMLDVIINYVKSLQNQIDFLSMKLSAASLIYDFNSPESLAIETIQLDPIIRMFLIQQGTAGYEAQGVEKVEGYGGFSQFHSSWPI